jgi:hypothetical protein
MIPAFAADYQNDESTHGEYTLKWLTRQKSPPGLSA